MVHDPATGSSLRAAGRRRHVGLTLPRRVKQDVLAAAEVIGWSAGDWVLAAAAEHGLRLVEAVGRRELARRARVDDATFTALYLTDDERDEIDEQASACGLNRSAFVTAVAQLALGHHLADVTAELAPGDPV